MDNEKEVKNLYRVYLILKDLGFHIVRAENNKEYLDKLKKYKLTPDFIQFPFEGNGSPYDFFMDLNYPNLSFIKITKVGKTLLNCIRRKQNITIQNNSILQAELQRIADSYNKKIEKYSSSRNNSPLFGWVTYFDLSRSKIPSIIDGRSIKWYLSENNLDDFFLECYVYFFYITAIDRIMGTCLSIEGIIKDEKWTKEVHKILDRLKFKNSEKAIIAAKLHDKCTFFMVIIELPNNKLQLLLFYNSRIIKSKDRRITNNLIINDLERIIS